MTEGIHADSFLNIIQQEDEVAPFETEERRLGGVFGNKTASEIVAENEVQDTEFIKTRKKISDTLRQISMDEELTSQRLPLTNFNDIILEDDELSFNLLKKTVHDTAYLESTEYAVSNAFARLNYTEEENQLLSPLEAERLTSEYGISDIKFDKDTKRGDVIMKIKNHKLKQSLAEDMNMYMQNRDLTAYENLALTASAISGAVGGAELLTTMALGVATAATFGATAPVLVAQVAKYVPTATRVANGIRYGRKVMAMEKVARTAQNSAKALRATNKAAQLKNAASADFLTSFGYDAIRFGGGATGGAGRASYLSTATAMAIDGAVSEIPFASMRAYNAELVSNPDYNFKNALCDIVTAGTFGALMPAGASLWRGTRSVGGRMFKRGMKATTRVIQDAEAEAIAKGYDADGEIFKGIKQQVDVVGERMREVAEQGRTNTDEMTETALSIAQDNLTPEEASDNLFYVIDALKEGKPLSVVLDALPHKNKFMSNVAGMYDFLTKNVDKNSLDLYYDMVGSGINITRVAGDVLKSGTLASYKIATEARALGRKAFKGLTDEQGISLMMDTYRWMLTGDEDALMRAIDNIDQMKRVSSKVAIILEDFNKTIGVAGRRTRVAEQLTSYRLANGRQGNLRDALLELADEMVYGQEKIELNEAKEILQRNLIYEAETGHVNPNEVDAVAKAKELLQARDKKVHEMLEYVDRKTGRPVELNSFDEFDPNLHYLNLKEKGIVTEGSKFGQSTFLSKLYEDLETAISDDFDLLYSDTLLSQLETDPQKLLEKLTGLDTENDVLHFNFVGDQQLYASGEKVNISQERRDLHFNELLATQANMPKTVTVLTNVLDKVNQALSGGKKTIGTLYQKCGEITSKCQAILDTDFQDVRQEVLSYLKTKYLPDIASAVKQSGDMKYISLVEAQGIKEASISEATRGLFDALNEKLLKPVIDALPETVVEGDVRTAFHESLSNFFKDLSSDDIEALIKSTDVTGLDKEADTAALAAREAQNKVLDKVLKPFLDEYASLLLDAQTSALNVQRVILNTFDSMIKTPAHAADVLMGKFSFVWHALTGSRFNVENLSDTTRQIQHLKAALSQAGLLEDAYGITGAENYIKIRKALHMINKYVEGDKVKEFGNIDTNDKYAQIALKFLDTLSASQRELFMVGSNKKKLLNLWDRNKLSNALLNIPGDIGIKIQGALANTLSNNKINTKLLELTTPVTELGKVGAQTNLNLYFLQKLDLDKQLNNTAGLSLNRVRDALLGEGSETLATLIKREGSARVTSACDFIADGLMGKKLDSGADSAEHLSLPDKLTLESKNPASIRKATRSKYIDDLDPMLYFKDDDSELEALQMWGYDNFATMAENNFKDARRAYAVLSTVGHSPEALIDEMVDLFNTYVQSDLSGIGKAGKNMVFDSGRVRSIKSTATIACGLGNSPSSTAGRIIDTLSRFTAPAMLAKAGIKSIADVQLHHTWLAQSGLSSGWNVNDWTKSVRAYGNVVRTKQLAQHLMLDNLLGADTLSRIFTPEDMGSPSIADLNQFATLGERVENASRKWSDFFLTKLAWVSPLTEHSRTAAALNIMESLAGFAGRTFDSLNTNLQRLLGAEGISQLEWDEIFTKYGAISVDEYSKRMGKAGAAGYEDTMMFIPEALDTVPDEVLTDVLKRTPGYEGIEVTADMLQKYKSSLIDRAQIMVTSGANEMTSLPTARVQSAMSGYQPQDSKLALMARVFTKFQSFGFAVSQIHWGRLLAEHIDPTNPVFTNLLVDAFRSGGARTTGNVLSFLVGSMVTYQLIQELVDFSSGSSTPWVNQEGGFNTDKIYKPFASSLGIYGVALDTALDATIRRGQGGGVSIKGAPVLSRVGRSLGNVKTAITRESNEGRRLEAGAWAVAENIASYTGVDNLPYTKAAYAWLVGDWIREQVLGAEDYARQQSNRERKGYRPSVIQQLTDTRRLQDMF